MKKYKKEQQQTTERQKTQHSFHSLVYCARTEVLTSVGIVSENKTNFPLL
jgi:hypothetical protein